MSSDSTAKRKQSVLKIVLISLLVVLSVSAILVYQNFNRLLADALMKTFNSSIISDVYELKFEKLRVNPFEGSVRVVNVVLQPREKPLKDYPYINSSMRLEAERLTLLNVEIFTLLRSNQLEVERISIVKPDINFQTNGSHYNLFPFSDTTSVTTEENQNEKKSIRAFTLKEFELIDASFHTLNSNKEREFNIQQFSISLNDLLVSPGQREYLTSFSKIVLSIGEFSGSLNKGPIQHVGFNDFKIGIDSLEMKLTLDTMTYRFHDFNSEIHNLDIQTADSLFHVTLQSFDLSYQSKSIQVKAVSFTPNVSHAVLQKDYQYQHTEFSGTVGTLDMMQVNFDSLLYARKIFIDEILLDKVKASIFKDKTKPLDTTRFPAYLGQTIMNIPLPVLIRHVKATHVELANTERIPDKTNAKVYITRATLEVNNITNLDPKASLTMSADAYVNNKARFKASLTFQYSKPQFAFEGVVQKFKLPDLNALIQAYTPAKIHQGILDELTFSGVAEKTNASGTLKFLYHDLVLDIEFQKAKWSNGLISFAANSILDSGNPSSADLPPRIVKFHIERDMNKGFVNVLIKSILNGLKETMIMSKENRKSYQSAKKKKAAG